MEGRNLVPTEPFSKYECSDHKYSSYGKIHKKKLCPPHNSPQSRLMPGYNKILLQTKQIHKKSLL